MDPKVFAFNNAYLSFVKDISTLDRCPQQVFDRTSDAYYKSFKEGAATLLAAVGSASMGAAAPDFVLEGCPLSQLYSEGGAENERALDRHILTLLAISLATDESLPLVVLKLEEVCGAPKGEPDLACVVDQDLYRVLVQLWARNEARDGIPEDVKAALQGTKLGRLAQEITDSLGLGAGDAAGVMDMSKLGDVIKKVGGIMTGKISRGELKCEDLLGEATSLLSKLQGSAGAGAGGADFLAEMLKMTQMASAAAGRGGLQERRERMRGKLAKRKAAKPPPRIGNAASPDS